MASKEFFNCTTSRGFTFATFERLRPCAREGVLEYIRQGECWGFGFFSGHSSNSMATAIFTGLMLRPIYKNVIYYMIVWSVVVAYKK